MSATKRILFAVCHADDEALWIGATLHGLAQLPSIDVAVACFSGAGVRAMEFETAQAVAGYARGVVLDLPLRSALEPLPDTGHLLDEALARLELSARDLDLLVTHSPYGDEHVNPHHRQAHHELRAWSVRQNVPFAFFSAVPSPFVIHRPVLTALRRSGPLHLLQLSRCRPTLRGLLLSREWSLLSRSRWFVQFLGDADVKRRMLECYASVDQAEFREGYGMYTSAAESFYIEDDAGAAVIRAIVNEMGVPSPVDLFRGGTVKTTLSIRARALAARARR